MKFSYTLLSPYRDSPLDLVDVRREDCDTKRKGFGMRQWLRAPVLAFSLLLNVVFIAFMLRKSHFMPEKLATAPSQSYEPSKLASEFANLARNVPKQWNSNSISSEQAWDELWNTTKMYPGIISLTDKYAWEKGLPRSQRFPWDQDKGIYLINGYHNLHCILNLERSLREYQRGLPQSGDWGHIRHCLLVLRDDIICNADDTPRYTGYQPPNRSGYGQVRMCRDWNKLEEWASQPEREGCWRNYPGYLGEKPDSTRRELLDRYRFCSEGSPYEEAAKTAWTDAADWDGFEDA